jgi:hypothetical protein
MDEEARQLPGSSEFVKKLETVFLDSLEKGEDPYRAVSRKIIFLNDPVSMRERQMTKQICCHLFVWKQYIQQAIGDSHEKA